MIRSNSRWWYWVAAVPAVVAFWLLSVAWVGVSVWLKFTPGELTTGLAQTALLAPLVAFGVPLAVLLAVLPYAIFRDAYAIHAAGAGWPPTARYAGSAALALLLAVAGVGLVEVGFPAIGGSVAVLGVLLAVAVSVFYVRERREHVRMPSSLREWREELRAR